MSARLQLQLLGAFGAQLNGVPLHFSYAKQAALLAYLAMAGGRPVTRREVGLLLWPDKPPDAVQTNLRKVISSLRKLLHGQNPAAAVLIADGDAITLSSDLDLWLDVTAFQALLADCTAHGHRHAASCPACYATRRAACELYGGDFLADLVLDDSDNFESWATGWREALRLQVLAAYQALAEYGLQRGRFLDASAAAAHLLGLDPLHEIGNQLAVLALAGAGQTAAALAQYEQFRRLVKRELDVEPAPATARIAAALRAGDALPDMMRAGNQAHAAALALPHAATLEPLIGRTVELNELNAWLNDPDRRLITITGLGGVGKTHLAAAVAREQSRVFADGVAYMPLADVPGPADFSGALCRILGIAVSDDHALLPQVASHIGSKDMLLVLDHFEHLLEARGDLLHLLQACGRLVILVTSRQRLGVAGEWVFRLGGLDIPPQGMEGTLDAYSAVRLFLHAARQTGRDLRLDAAEGAAIGEICRLVQGLPLALVLLGAWVRLLPCTELLAELRCSIDVVRSAYPDADAKEINLRSVLQQSWQILPVEQRTVLSALAVFQCEFDRRDAAAVAGADLDVLAGLVDRSLLQVSAEGRYSWHELVQQFCAEQLALAGRRETVAARHFAYYLVQAEQNAAELAAMRNLAAFLWFGRERANLQAAAAWARSRGSQVNPRDLQRLLSAVERAGHRWGIHMGGSGPGDENST